MCVMLMKGPTRKAGGQNKSPMRDLFVVEYLKDLNVTQAAIRAGYSRKTARQAGARLLSNVDIARLIDEAKRERQEKLKIDAEWVLRQAIRLYDRCMGKDKQFFPRSAAQALELIGKNVVVKAFQQRINQTINNINLSLAEDLNAGRERARKAKESVH